MHAFWMRQVPSPQAPELLHTPTTWSSKQGPASGGRRPPHATCTTQRRTSSQASPPPHMRSMVHAGSGSQCGPACEVEGVEPTGQLAGGGPTTSARAPESPAREDPAKRATNATDRERFIVCERLPEGGGGQARRRQATRRETRKSACLRCSRSQIRVRPQRTPAGRQTMLPQERPPSMGPRTERHRWDGRCIARPRDSSAPHRRCPPRARGDSDPRGGEGPRSPRRAHRSSALHRPWRRDRRPAHTQGDARSAAPSGPPRPPSRRDTRRAAARCRPRGPAQR